MFRRQDICSADRVKQASHDNIRHLKNQLAQPPQRDRRSQRPADGKQSALAAHTQIKLAVQEPIWSERGLKTSIT